MAPRHRIRFHGFSLVELLVILAIASILLAILVPTISGVKQRTKSLDCSNRLRQIGTAILLYGSDEGHYPYSGHALSWADWGESLLPYIDLELKDTHGTRFIHGEPWALGLLQFNDGFPGWNHTHLDHSIGQGVMNPATKQVYYPGWSYFTCPAVTVVSKHSAQYRAYGQFQSGVHQYPHTYSANEHLMPNNSWGAYVAGVIMPPVKPQDVERPGSVVLICDAGLSSIGEASDTITQVKQIIQSDFESDPAGAPARGQQPMTTPSASDNDLGPGDGWPVYSRHGGRCMAVMADGHLEAFKNGELKRRNFVSKEGRTPNSSSTGYVEASYP